MYLIDRGRFMHDINCIIWYVKQTCIINIYIFTPEHLYKNSRFKPVHFAVHDQSSSGLYSFCLWALKTIWIWNKASLLSAALLCAGCVSVRQRVTQSENILQITSCTGTGPPRGGNEIWVMCCSWLTFALIPAERQMQASVRTPAPQALWGKRVHVKGSDTEMHGERREPQCSETNNCISIGDMWGYMRMSV